MSVLGIGVIPHVIPAATFANGDLNRTFSEPLADGRDEPLYLVCTHPRVRLGRRDHTGSRPVYAAGGDIGGLQWLVDSPWATVRLPNHVRPSRFGWAVIDPDLEAIEHLPPIEVPDDDPDGPDGRFRAELLPWVYDRHLEAGRKDAEARGSVSGGHIRFRVQYVGQRAEEALRRPFGPHQKVSAILANTLFYSPSRLIYLLPCEVRVTLISPDQPEEQELQMVADFCAGSDLLRSEVIDAAEHALIAAFDPEYNTSNTGRRKFPNSASAGALREKGISAVGLQFFGVPDGMTIAGPNWCVNGAADGRVFELT